MKIALVILSVLLCLGLLGGMAFVLFVMEDQPAAPASSSQSQGQGQQNPPDAQLDVKHKAETPADVLEALDYEISVNRDTVGWLTVPGTDINNSVLQSFDNSYYERRNEREEDAVYGCYFVDYECSVGTREELSPNLVIYGHSDLTDNPDGPRFSQLFRFTDETFAKNHPVIEFSTMEEFTAWEIFSVMYTDLEFNYISADPAMGIDRMAAVAMEKSLYDYGVTVAPDDHVMVLSTCTVAFGEDSENYRFVVMARLLGEDEEVPVEAALTVKPAQTQE